MFRCTRSEVLNRWLVAAVFVPLVPFSVYRWHGVLFSVFLFVCSALGFHEYTDVLANTFKDAPEIDQRLHARLKPVSYAIVCMWQVAGALGPYVFIMSMQVCIVVYAAACVVLLVRWQARVSNWTLSVVACHFFGVYWITWSVSTHLLSEWWGEYRPALLSIMLLSSWASDGLAFFVGRDCGRRRVAPSVSPRKTVEGGVASVFAGTFSTVGLWVLFGSALGLPPLPTSFYAVLGLLTSLLGVVGDLFASMVKRAGAIKDSGALFGDHGGMLDRFDTFFVMGPLFLFVPTIAAHVYGVASPL